MEPNQKRFALFILKAMIVTLAMAIVAATMRVRSWPEVCLVVGADATMLSALAVLYYRDVRKSRDAG